MKNNRYSRPTQTHTRQSKLQSQYANIILFDACHELDFYLVAKKNASINSLVDCFVSCQDFFFRCFFIYSARAHKKLPPNIEIITTTKKKKRRRIEDDWEANKNNKQSQWHWQNIKRKKSTQISLGIFHWKWNVDELSFQVGWLCDQWAIMWT